MAHIPHGGVSAASVLRLAVIQQQVFVVTEIAVAALFSVMKAWEAGVQGQLGDEDHHLLLSAKAFSIKSNAASSAALVVSCVPDPASARDWNCVRRRSKAGCVLTALARRSSASQLRRAAYTCRRVFSVMAQQTGGTLARGSRHHSPVTI